MEFGIGTKAVMTVTTETGLRVAHRARAKYQPAIYDAPKKRFLNVYRTQIPPANALTDQVLMSNGQQWGYRFDYLACRVTLYTVDEGEEYTDQTVGLEYGVEDWSVFRKVVCPELSLITKGYSVFTGHEYPGLLRTNISQGENTKKEWPTVRQRGVLYRHRGNPKPQT
jgi:hypothetical protein